MHSKARIGIGVNTGDFLVDFLSDNLQRLNIVPKQLACLHTCRPVPRLPCLNFLLLWCTFHVVSVRLMFVDVFCILADLGQTPVTSV